jgi:hypothetical protein
MRELKIGQRVTIIVPADVRKADTDRWRNDAGTDSNGVASGKIAQLTTWRVLCPNDDDPPYPLDQLLIVLDGDGFAYPAEWAEELFIDDVPGYFVELASRWHEGQHSMMYALSSTGNLTPGTTRYWNDDTQAPMTAQEQHCHLWDDLECEARRSYEAALKIEEPDADCDGDLELLGRLARYADAMAKNLRNHYHITCEVCHKLYGECDHTTE